MDQQRSLRPREERNYTIEVTIWVIKNEGFSSKCENETLKKVFFLSMKRKSFKNPKTMPEIFAEFIQNTNSCLSILIKWKKFAMSKTENLFQSRIKKKKRVSNKLVCNSELFLLNLRQLNSLLNHFHHLFSL